MARQVLSLLAILALFSIQSGECLECYTNNGGIETCQDTETVCQKTEFINGEVSKGCSKAYSQFGVNECIYDNENVDVNSGAVNFEDKFKARCQCDEDLCNSGMGLKMSLLSLLPIATYFVLM
eukprot:TRINITY_DN2921_c0_g1_i6.p1 TRINITY_DN2921_c0_g1~~TRINITY_DN2921_c0_g1_i6.p1  ORF type:complete len:123 (-),score=19.62 TRINITY_DN2921_c0_g1_i6:44-412(-)